MINGKVISKSGGKHIEMINASVSFLKDKERIRLVSTGLNSLKENHHEHVQWIENTSLKPSDAVTINILDSDDSDTPNIVKNYGKVISGDGHAIFYCSFCGAEAGKDIQVLVSQNANICHDCLRRYNPDKNNV